LKSYVERSFCGCELFGGTLADLGPDEGAGVCAETEQAIPNRIAITDFIGFDLHLLIALCR
jgi:hypothetical protein